MSKGDKLFSVYKSIKSFSADPNYELTGLTNENEVTPNIGTAGGIFWKPNGRKSVLSDYGNNNLLTIEYSTPWDISTFNVTQTSSYGNGNPVGVVLKPDGTKLYVMDFNGEVDQYDLSTAWDVTTRGSSVSFGVNAEFTGMSFNSDGTKMYCAYRSLGEVESYSLSTAWDVSTASFIQGTQHNQTGVTGIDFNGDYTKCFLSDKSGTIASYDLGSSDDISSLTVANTFETGMNLSRDVSWKHYNGAGQSLRSRVDTNRDREDQNRSRQDNNRSRQDSDRRRID